MSTKVSKKKVSKKKLVKKSSNSAKYPRHSLEKSMRIPQGILDQNAGKECSEEDSAKYVGVKFNKGPFASELSSCKKYGLLDSPSSGRLRLTELGLKILRPQAESDKRDGLRESVLQAPDISEVYNHYRNENLPDSSFFDNALIDKFKIPQDKVGEFKKIFFESLETAELIQEHDGKKRILDVSVDTGSLNDKTETLKKLERKVKITEGDSCFVMMPFAEPLGSYYSKVYAPAIEKAKLKSVRADDEIFKTGKIIEQIWDGISNAKVLIADLTGRNPNVFYELGLAHALGKPVVLVCSNEEDVPFDLRHIRVIYYDMTDPFWGRKLIDKISENLLSALENPSEAVFQKVLINS